MNLHMYIQYSPLPDIIVLTVIYVNKQVSHHKKLIMAVSYLIEYKNSVHHIHEINHKQIVVVVCVC